MRINTLARDRRAQPSMADAASGSQACYAPPAPLLDILVEQIEYLAAHVSHACPPDCAECIRLSQVTNWLLLPFRPNGTSRYFERRLPK
jgi:hypothetical protein